MLLPIWKCGLLFDLGSKYRFDELGVDLRVVNEREDEGGGGGVYYISLFFGLISLSADLFPALPPSKTPPGRTIPRPRENKTI